jgi:hypothetical protein
MWLRCDVCRRYARLEGEGGAGYGRVPGVVKATFVRAPDR